MTVSLMRRGAMDVLELGNFVAIILKVAVLVAFGE